MERKLLALILAAVAFSSSTGGVYAGTLLARGPPGAPGANGANGPSGANGTNGINGLNGTNGKNGTNGTTTVVRTQALGIPATVITKVSNTTQYFLLLSLNATSYSSMVMRISAYTTGCGGIALQTITVANATGFPTETITTAINVGLPEWIVVTFVATNLLFISKQSYMITLSGGNCLGPASSQYSFSLA